MFFFGVTAFLGNVDFGTPMWQLPSVGSSNRIFRSIDQRRVAEFEMGADWTYGAMLFVIRHLSLIHRMTGRTENEISPTAGREVEIKFASHRIPMNNSSRIGNFLQLFDRFRPKLHQSSPLQRLVNETWTKSSLVRTTGQCTPSS